MLLSGSLCSAVSKHILISLLFVHVFWTHRALALTELSKPTSSRKSSSFCPSRTVNYITHSLPQQCLKSSWASTVPTASPSASSPSDGNTIQVSQLVSLEPSSRGTEPINDAQSASSQVPSEPLEKSTEAVSPTPSSDDATPISEASEAATPTESELDSPLDTANFLSFEDWKEKNLAKVGQSAEHVGNDRTGSATRDTRKRPGNINNALDALGEDAEIELDFSGFVGPGATDEVMSTAIRGSSGSQEDLGRLDRNNKKEGPAPGTFTRSKDAGKTFKERFNYASFDCAAQVLKTNKQCSGSSSLLVENKDSYMLNQCAASNKFFIVELCNDILVDTIVLANFEFFSSIFRQFRVSVSDRYPVKLEKWRELGTYEARNTREVQAFLVENPLIWARYLRIEFLTHYGSEYYCPISLLRVHGTTMIEEFRHQEEAAIGDDDENEDGSAEKVASGEKVVMEAIADSVAIDQKRADKVDADNIPSASEESASSGDATVAAKAEIQGFSPHNKREAEALLVSRIFSINHLCSAIDLDENHPVAATSHSVLSSSATTMSNTGSESHTASSSEPTSTAPIQPSPDAVLDRSRQAQANSTVSSISQSSSPIPVSIARSVSESATSKYKSASQSPPPPKGSNGTSTESTRSAASPTHPPPANPTTQESFFKSIHKRLQMLEANSTLSLQYIEDQSRILRDAFNKVEKRQLTKTTNFLENLNTTVLNELRGFRQQYDQIWQSTVIELENQREQSQKEVMAVAARLSILADEVIFQKRMAMLQTIVVILCLGFVVFTRGPGSSHLEIPLMTNMLLRSPSSRRPRSPNYDSTVESPPSTRPSSMRSLGFLRRQQRHQFTDSTDDMKSPIIAYSPPTPTSQDTGLREDSRVSSPEPVIDEVERPRSSPATPSGTRKVKSDPLEWQANDARDDAPLRPSDASSDGAYDFDDGDDMEDGLMASPNG